MATGTEINIADEVRRATHEMLDELADRLAGRVFSPRIKLLSIDQVCAATGFSQSTIYQKVADGTFPKPQKNLGQTRGHNRWREATLIAWCEKNDPNGKVA